MARVHRLAGPVGAASSGDTSLCTVPSDERWLVREIQLVNAGLSSEHKLGINGTGDDDLIWTGIVGTNSFVTPPLVFVLEADDELVINTVIGSNTTVTVSGTTYTGA